jgi:D-aspartate ligase
LPIEADGEALLVALDKEATYRRARELGVPAPNTVCVRTTDDVATAASNLDFPFAVKPVSSHRFWETLRWNDPELVAAWAVHPKGIVLDDKDQFLELVEPLVALGIEVLATEVVVGLDSAYTSYYTYLDTDGEPLCHFTKRKLRQLPIHFGTGTFHQTKWQPDVADLGLRLCQGLGLRGICNVEFKRDSRSGELRLIECNARLTASDALERKAGLDLPWIAYSRALGAPVTVPSQFSDGLCLWLPLDDLRAFRSYWRAGELSTTEWLASLAHRQSFTVFDLSDIGPGFTAFYTTFYRRLKSIPSRLVRASARVTRSADARAGEHNPNSLGGAERQSRWSRPGSGRGCSGAPE